MYLRAYDAPNKPRAGLAGYFEIYNTQCGYTALDRRTPDAVYFEQVAPRHAA